MPEYREVTGTIRVPENTGLEGFMHAIQSILKRPRVQELRVDARGQVKYRRYLVDGEGRSQPERVAGPQQITP